MENSVLVEPKNLKQQMPSEAKKFSGNGFFLDSSKVSQFDNANFRIFENTKFDLRLYENVALTAGVVDDENWGLSSIGFDLGLLGNIHRRGEGVKIGTADTGVDLTHPCFDVHRSEGKFRAFAEFDADGQKVVQTGSDGTVLADERANPTFSDYHGTHTACVLVGNDVNNKKRGFAPFAELFACRFSGSVASFKSCFHWLGEQKCDVICLSLGQPGKNEAWASEIQNLVDRGALVCVASGNEYGVAGYESRSPGNYPIQSLVSVGAFAKDRTVWPRSGGEVVRWPPVVQDGNGNAVPSVFSDSPIQTVPRLVAPGVEVNSAAPFAEYKKATGTSMATPHIAGLAAVILSVLRQHDASIPPSVVHDIITKDVDDLGVAGHDDRYGVGVPNLTKIKQSIDDFLN